MKSKRWIWVTLTILLTLIVLVGVAGISFRMGAMQGANLGSTQQFQFMGRMHGFNNNGANNQQGGNQQFGDPRMMQGFGDRGPMMMRGGFGRGRGGFFSPLFGLLHLVLFVALIWIGYKLIKNSGWRITRNAAPAAAVSETPSAVVEEKKE